MGILCTMQERDSQKEELLSFPIQEYFEVSIDLLKLTSEERFEWLALHTLENEHKVLREPLGVPQISAEGKLHFLTGGPNSDVTMATNFDGTTIYTRELPMPRPKFAEIPEALGAISHWFDDLEKSKVTNEPTPNSLPVIAEVADVVYCMAHLTILDEPFAEQYRIYIDRISASLGMNTDDIVMIALLKYNFRHGKGFRQRDLEKEYTLISKLFEPENEKDTPRISYPTTEGMRQGFHVLSEISGMLNLRLKQLEQNYLWLHPSDKAQESLSSSVY
jgi:hypothetical protein